MPSSTLRYDLFGWDYESINPLTDAEVAWHLTWAQRTKGPVLALACGTGRLVCRLTREGHEVVGLDLSKAMLDLARRNVAKLPAKARKRVTLVRGDMSAFDLGRRFGLIFIADNSFRELETRRKLLSALRCIRRHLAPGGRVLITERRLEPSVFSGGKRSFDWTPPVRHPDTGNLISRRGEITLSRDRKRFTGRLVYNTIASNGCETMQEFSVRAPALCKEDYAALFLRAGFAVCAYPGYREEPDDGKDPLLCFALGRHETRM